MLSISLSSRYFMSRWIGSHLIRGGGKGLLPNFPKSLILKSVIFGKNIRSFLHRWRIHHSFFFFFVGIKSIDWIPPKTRPWRHQSGRFYLFIRGCANSTNRGRRRRRKHRWIFFPSLCFRLESIPAQTRQTNRGRGGIWIFQTRDHSV